MPIYAYRCAECGHAKDVLQKLSDLVLTVCPACGASAFAKQVTAAGFQLKGSGWYATDFKGGAAAPAATAPAADAKPAPDTATGDSKPATDSKSASTSTSANTSKPAGGESKPAASAAPCGGSCACH
ncbi:MAG: zinc ribbon domain-containing protein [Burkholderiales bacterium]|nr:zinc ribbon domain-containing protein [Burkholderiales bacterium]